MSIRRSCRRRVRRRRARICAPWLGRIADRFFGWPSQHLRITGITGTNGKTTCAFLLAQCQERLGSRAAYIGTIGWGRPIRSAAPTHTTPDVITVHRLLAQLRGEGVRKSPWKSPRMPWIRSG